MSATIIGTTEPAIELNQLSNDLSDAVSTSTALFTPWTNVCSVNNLAEPDIAFVGLSSLLSSLLK